MFTLSFGICLSEDSQFVDGLQVSMLYILGAWLEAT